MASGRRSRQNSLLSGVGEHKPPHVSARPDVGRVGSGGQQPGQFGVLTGVGRARVDVRAERPSRQGRCCS